MILPECGYKGFLIIFYHKLLLIIIRFILNKWKLRTRSFEQNVTINLANVRLQERSYGYQLVFNKIPNIFQKFSIDALLKHYFIQHLVSVLYALLFIATHDTSELRRQHVFQSPRLSSSGGKNLFVVTDLKNNRLTDKLSE